MIIFDLPFPNKNVFGEIFTVRAGWLVSFQSKKSYGINYLDYVKSYLVNQSGVHFVSNGAPEGQYLGKNKYSISIREKPNKQLVGLDIDGKFAEKPHAFEESYSDYIVTPLANSFTELNKKSEFIKILFDVENEALLIANRKTKQTKVINFKEKIQGCVASFDGHTILVISDKIYILDNPV